MNKVYKPAQVISLETAKTPLHHAMENKMALIEAIQDRDPNRSSSILKTYTTKQLEALLEYGSPFAFASVKFTDDRNFLTTRNGKVHKGVEIEAGRDFRDWHDMRVMNKIKGYRAYKRIQFSTKDKTPEELKEDKISEILSTIDDRYKMVINHIINHDMKALVEICINKYEVNIRKIIAALLRIRGPEYGQFPTIEQACDALGVSKKDFLSAATELQDKGIYTRQKILQNHEVIIEQSYNLIYDLKNYHPEIDDTVTQLMLEEIPLAYGYLKDQLHLLRLQKVIPLVLMVAKRYVELSPIQILTPLMKHPDYQQEYLRNGITSFNNLDRNVPEFDRINLITSGYYHSVPFKQLFDTDDHIITRARNFAILERLGNSQTNVFSQSLEFDVDNIRSVFFEVILYNEDTNMKSKILLQCGLPGALHRSQYKQILQYLDEGFEESHISILTSLSRQAWINVSTYLGRQKYRLDPIELSENINLIQVDNNFNNLITAVNSLSSKYKYSNPSEGGLLIISDIRPYLHSSSITSNLDDDTNLALENYAKLILSEHSKNDIMLLKSELASKLLDYKEKYVLDRSNQERIDQTHSSSEIDNNNLTWTRGYLKHQPRIGEFFKSQLKQWLKTPNIIVGTTFSNDVFIGAGGEEELYHKKIRMYKELIQSKDEKNGQKIQQFLEEPDKNLVLDYVIASFDHLSFVSSSINNPYEIREIPITQNFIGEIC